VSGAPLAGDAIISNLPPRLEFAFLVIGGQAKIPGRDLAGAQKKVASAAKTILRWFNIFLDIWWQGIDKEQLLQAEEHKTRPACSAPPEAFGLVQQFATENDTTGRRKTSLPMKHWHKSAAYREALKTLLIQIFLSTEQAMEWGSHLDARQHTTLTQTQCALSDAARSEFDPERKMHLAMQSQLMREAAQAFVPAW
jgi:hypothetical protein